MEKLKPIKNIMKCLEELSDEKRRAFLSSRELSCEYFDKEGSVFLMYDEGLGEAVQSIVRTLKARRKWGCPLEWEAIAKMCGWAGQFAFDDFLNRRGIDHRTDQPFYTDKGEPQDFLVRVRGVEKRIEVKTTQYGPKHKDLRVYKERWHKPNYVIGMKCMNEAFTIVGVYGWLRGSEVESLPSEVYLEGERWATPLVKLHPIAELVNLLSDFRKKSATKGKF